MKCPRCKAPIPLKDLMSELGKKGGKSTSDAKLAAVTANLEAVKRHMNLARSEAGCPDDETLVMHCRQLRDQLAAAQREIAELRKDRERLTTLESMLRAIPSLHIAFCDDPDEECEDTESGMAPCGFRIVSNGCQGTRCDVAETLREVIDRAAVDDDAIAAAKEGK